MLFADDIVQVDKTKKEKNIQRREVKTSFEI